MIRTYCAFLAALAFPWTLDAADNPSTAKSVPYARPVRVMSYNIRYATAPDGENHWSKRKEFLIETIRAFDPDLLGTQETLPIQRDYLAKSLPEFESFAAGRDDGKDGGEMAALFYRRARFEKLAGGHFWLSQTPEQPGSKGWDAAFPRIATWVKLKDRASPDAAPILFLNTHLDHRGVQARRESALLIRRKLVDLAKDCRVIVTGDFNAAEKSQPYDALFADLDGIASPIIDTYRMLHPTRGLEEGTFSSFKASQTNRSRIDWIACSRDWIVRQAGIDRTARDGRTPSDHFAVTAVLRAASPGEAPTLRVLCYNIHHGEGTDGKVDLPRLARVIRDADPDLVALQEVDNKTKRTGSVDQTAELARLTGMHGRFGKAIDYSGGEYGQAVLSRFAIGKDSVDQLPGEPEREQRIAFSVHVNVDGKDTVFVTTHLHHQNAEFRERQAAKLTELFRNLDQLVILAGDLNAVPSSKPVELLKKDWVLATTAPGLLTYPSSKPVRQIDYVWYRPQGMCRVVESKVLEEPVASDHRPVLSILEFTPASHGARH